MTTPVGGAVVPGRSVTSAVQFVAWPGFTVAGEQPTNVRVPCTTGGGGGGGGAAAARLAVAVSIAWPESPLYVALIDWFPATIGV